MAKIWLSASNETNYTARVIANLPLGPSSLINAYDNEVVTLITALSRSGHPTSIGHPDLGLLPAVSLIDYLCKCQKVEPLTS